jgi:hypothetical protein
MCLDNDVFVLLTVQHVAVPLDKAVVTLPCLPLKNGTLHKCTTGTCTVMPLCKYVYYTVCTLLYNVYVLRGAESSLRSTSPKLL